MIETTEITSLRETLDFSGLHKRYGALTALDDLSFSVPPGQVFGFLGPNGAGKTTTMRALFGLASLDAGEIRWQGQLVTDSLRRGFGYMPEERGLYPGMPVLEQVTYFGRLHGLPRGRARDAARHWIGRLGLADRQDTKVEALSHGNQQRVQLAAALLHDPRLLVLDEPFAGLDPGGIDEMSQVLAERVEAGVTVVFSSHQLDLVEHLCQSVAIIHRGRVVRSGSVTGLTRGDQSRLAVRVAGDPEGRWAGTLAPELGTVRETGSGTVLIELAAGGNVTARSQRVLDAARAAGPVEHFGYRSWRLSEVFRRVTGASVAEAEGQEEAR